MRQYVGEQKWIISRTVTHTGRPFILDCLQVAPWMVYKTVCSSHLHRLRHSILDDTDGEVVFKRKVSLYLRTLLLACCCNSFYQWITSFSLWAVSCTSSSRGSHGTSSGWPLPSGGDVGGRPSPAHLWTSSGCAHKPSTHEQHCLMQLCGRDGEELEKVGSVESKWIKGCSSMSVIWWQLYSAVLHTTYTEGTYALERLPAP